MAMHPNLLASAALAACLVAACGGGSSPADVRPNVDPPQAPVTGPDKFLLFPNPQQQADGSLQMDSDAYTEAYYRAIDPGNERDTLAKFKAKNGFETGTGEEHLVIFGDQRDLGYGRRMYARRNADGTMAFYVENYLLETNGQYLYNTLNLDAAIVRQGAHMVGVNAIEFSPGPNGGASFPKFYNFDATTLQRATRVDLDGRGDKAMPGPCISCHGGRGDALTPPDASGKRLFNLVRNTVSQQRGDVAARLHPFEPDTFEFSATRAGFSRAEQEAAIKSINRMILCSYPLPAPSPHPEDACRPVASDSEWQGTAATLIKSAYGGDGLPNATFHDNYVPPSWEQAGQSTLYRSVIATSCRTCHIMRGTAGNSDLDFTTYEKFVGFAERTKHHVFERGNMPLAKIVFDAFWSSNRPGLLADYLQAQGHNVRAADGSIPRPGRAVSEPGPDRVAPVGATPLSASGSQFANGYAWSLVSGPSGATLTNASSVSATLTTTQPGTYVVRLVASNGSEAGAPKEVRIVAVASLSPAPAAIRFADIKASMQQTVGSCTQCHAADGQLPRPPVFYTNDDRNGDGTVGDATDDAWFYEEVRSRINFTDVGASALLRKPSGNHHGGNLVAGFDTTKAPGDPARSRYDLFLNWILSGAPR
jgi:mono/diheme cytochrome c family protein